MECLGVPYIIFFPPFTHTHLPEQLETFPLKKSWDVSRGTTDVLHAINNVITYWKGGSVSGPHYSPSSFPSTGKSSALGAPTYATSHRNKNVKG